MKFQQRIQNIDLEGLSLTAKPKPPKKKSEKNTAEGKKAARMEENKKKISDKKK